MRLCIYVCFFLCVCLCVDHQQEEEFEGFTAEDVRIARKKLKAVIQKEKRLQAQKLQSLGIHRVPSIGHMSHILSQEISHESDVEETADKEAQDNPEKEQGQGDNSGTKISSKDMFLQKALAARELLASLKAKHKHALQGRVIQKVGRPRKHSVRDDKISSPCERTGEKASPEKQIPAENTPKQSEQVHKPIPDEREQNNESTSHNLRRHRPSSEMPKPHKLRKVKVADKVKMTWPKLTKKVISSKVKISEKQSRALEKRPKSVVKQILKKARRGHGRPRRGAKHVIDADKVVKRGRGRPPSKIKGTPHSGEKDSPVQPSHHKRATPMFVLPQYSRSSRVIIPNKRFLEEDSLVGSLLSKRPRMDTCSDTVSSSSKGKHLDKADSVNPVTHTLSGHWSDKSEAPSSGSQLSGIPQLDKSDISKTTKKGVKVRTRSASGQLSSVTLEKSEQHKTGDANLTTPRIKKKASKPQSLIEDAFASNAEESTESAITSSSSCMTTGRKLGKADQAASSSDNTTVSLPKGKPSTDTECQANPATSSGVDFDSVSGDLVGHVSTEELSPFKRGLLEQPLIVEGKRLRMPSLKVRMKLGLEASAEDLSEKTAAAGEKEDSAKNTISNREELNHAEVMESKFMLFPREPSSAPKAFFRAGPMKLHHHGKDGKESLLTKRSGQIVLRKAKLQLNRTALNRSKAALARSLKAQLKREARQQGKRHEMQGQPSLRSSVTSPLSISVFPGASHPFDSPTSQSSPLLSGLSPSGCPGGFGECNLMLIFS